MTLAGYNDAKFEQLFVQFINELQFASMNDLQKEILFSHALLYNNVTRPARQFLIQWLAQNQEPASIEDPPPDVSKNCQRF